MHPSWIFGSMLASGIALFSTAAWIEADHRAWTSAPLAREESTIRATVSSLKVEEEVAAPEREDSMVMLPPVEITARKPRVQARPQPVEPAIATEPCSQWQDIGPARVDDGNPIGVRRVRSLCLGPLAILK